MKVEYAIALALILGAATMVTYFIVSNWWPHMRVIPVTHGISCKEELAAFQYSLELSKRQQVESILMTNPAIKKFVDNSRYCEFMGLGTLYSGNGSYQILNLNLNDTNELTAEVSLQNNSVVSYSISPLNRTFPAIYVEPPNVILPILFFGIIAAGLAVYLVKIRKK